ncbi:hypothetical protein Tco_1063258, partial [Tanacetum coccineum]
MNFQAEMNRLQEMLSLRNSNYDPPVDLYDLEESDEGDMEINSLTTDPSDTLLMGDEVIITTPVRENDEFIKSSIDDLVPIPRESNVTLVCDDLECSVPVNTPLPTTDVREENFDINSPLGKHIIPFDESKVHIEVLSVLWGNRLPIPDGSLPLSWYKGMKTKQNGDFQYATWHSLSGPRCDPIVPNPDRHVSCYISSDVAVAGSRRTRLQACQDWQSEVQARWRLEGLTFGWQCCSMRLARDPSQLL